mmetsp:Transcript_8279/g.17655  ORF Transcript_8279/g.17655 Transcript_8279/m.17655 type:complete len:169 (+) Transcript_8279:68-574(+)
MNIHAFGPLKSEQKPFYSLDLYVTSHLYRIVSVSHAYLLRAQVSKYDRVPSCPSENGTKNKSNNRYNLPAAAVPQPMTPSPLLSAPFSRPPPPQILTAHPPLHPTPTLNPKPSSPNPLTSPPCVLPSKPNSPKKSWVSITNNDFKYSAFASSSRRYFSFSVSLWEFHF